MGDCARVSASTPLVAVQVSPPCTTRERVVILACVVQYVNRRYHTTDATLLMCIFSFVVSFVHTSSLFAAKVDSNLHCRTSEWGGWVSAAVPSPATCGLSQVGCRCLFPASSCLPVSLGAFVAT